MTQFSLGYHTRRYLYRGFFLTLYLFRVSICSPRCIYVLKNILVVTSYINNFDHVLVPELRFCLFYYYCCYNFFICLSYFVFVYFIIIIVIIYLFFHLCLFFLFTRDHHQEVTLRNFILILVIQRLPMHNLCLFAFFF